MEGEERFDYSDRARVLCQSTVPMAAHLVYLVAYRRCYAMTQSDYEKSTLTPDTKISVGGWGRGCRGMDGVDRLDMENGEMAIYGIKQVETQPVDENLR